MPRPSDELPDWKYAGVTDDRVREAHRDRNPIYGNELRDPAGHSLLWYVSRAAYGDFDAYWELAVAGAPEWQRRFIMRAYMMGRLCGSDFSTWTPAGIVKACRPAVPYLLTPEGFEHAVRIVARMLGFNWRILRAHLKAHGGLLD